MIKTGSALALAALLLACRYQPAFDRCKVRCGPAGGNRCPSGLTCGDEGYCHRPGDPATCLPRTDGSPPDTEDDLDGGAATDGAPPVAAPDAALDLALDGAAPASDVSGPRDTGGAADLRSDGPVCPPRAPGMVINGICETAGAHTCFGGETLASCQDIGRGCLAWRSQGSGALDMAGPIRGAGSVCAGSTGVAFAVDAIRNATGYTWTYSGTGLAITAGDDRNTITTSFSDAATSGMLTVAARNPCGMGAASPPLAITVRAKSAVAAPQAAGARVVRQNSFLATWNRVLGATSYRLEVALDPAFADLLPGYDHRDVGNAIAYIVSVPAAGTTYHYRVSASDGGCGAGASSNALPVTTAPGTTKAWRAADPIATAAGYADGPQVAMAGNGNALAVWAQSDVSSNDIWARRYVAGTGWQPAVRIETSDAEHSRAPQVAMDGGDNAIAVWQQNDGRREAIWAARFVPATGWGSAVRIDAAGTASAQLPQIAIDGAGNAIAVWQQGEGAHNDIWASRHVVGTGWTAPVAIENETRAAVNPQIAVAGDGEATAVWWQADGTTRASRFVPGTGWGSVTLVDSANAGTTRNPQAAADGKGNVTVVWHQSDGSQRYNTGANRYVPGTGWGSGMALGTDSAGSALVESQLAVNPAGVAVTVWQQFDGTTHNIWASRYLPGVGWEGAAIIESGTGEATYPQVAIDGAGNATAVWQQHDGTRKNIWTNRQLAGMAWGTAMLIETDDADARDPQIAAGDGKAVVVWLQGDGAARTIMSARLE